MSLVQQERWATHCRGYRDILSPIPVSTMFCDSAMGRSDAIVRCTFMIWQIRLAWGTDMVYVGYKLEASVLYDTVHRGPNRRSGDTGHGTDTWTVLAIGNGGTTDQG